MRAYLGIVSLPQIFSGIPLSPMSASCEIPTTYNIAVKLQRLVR